MLHLYLFVRKARPLALPLGGTLRKNRAHNRRIAYRLQQRGLDIQGTQYKEADPSENSASSQM